jgi:hypothetical protein
MPGTGPCARNWNGWPREPARSLVGVCWGAGHMRAVIALLHTRLGYRIVSASWITVF